MNEERLVVGLDVSGPHEPLGNWLSVLADALEATDHCRVVRFATGHEPTAGLESRLATRALWRPLWRRGRGRAVDRALLPVDVVHVAGPLVPPTRSVPLVVSVDDLRPLREARRDHQRVAQLRRAASRGAQLVASSRAASLEVQRSLGLSREQVVIAAPAVPSTPTPVDGAHLVVNLTGRLEAFMKLGRAVSALAAASSSPVVVLASHDAAARIRQAGLRVQLRPRREAATVLADARAVVHLSDGARFPTFTVAALGAGVPTCASATAANRELLEGASLLVDDEDGDAVLAAIDTLLNDPARRAVLSAAGRDRAHDFRPEEAAGRFLGLYERLVAARVSP